MFVLALPLPCRLCSHRPFQLNPGCMSWMLAQLHRQPPGTPDRLLRLPLGYRLGAKNRPCPGQRLSAIGSHKRAMCHKRRPGLNGRSRMKTRRLIASSRASAGAVDRARTRERLKWRCAVANGGLRNCASQSTAPFASEANSNERLNFLRRHEPPSPQRQWQCGGSLQNLRHLGACCRKQALLSG